MNNCKLIMIYFAEIFLGPHSDLTKTKKIDRSKMLLREKIL